ncbi:MAG: substrate-binding domain-containing protein [Prevotella sp.]|nr:substrate-binding domain-containing protein [Prevotella sp.]
MTKFYWFVALLMITLSSCSQNKKQYTIGVSQCSEDIWREKQNAELRMGAYFHDNVELKFAAAYDSDERQVQQIDSLMNEGIDLLIVAPNQVNTISPAIDRAYDKGIPVIVFERKTSSQKYTAFISADNYEMGRVMGEYIVSRLHGKGNVLEIKGLAGSSPSIERHNGFMEAIKDEPGIKVVGSLQGDWTESTACQITKQWLTAHEGESVDLVFGANDRMAMGAREVLGEKPLYCGIDGLPGKDGGIQLVRDSLFDASFIYPTHGDQIIDLAIRILEGQSYEKETLLMSALVTHDNAKVLLMQSEEMMKQASRLDQLHEKADSYMQELGAQRVVNWLALGFIFLLIGLFVLFYLYHLRKVALQRERVVSTLWNMRHENVNVGNELNEEPVADGKALDKEEQEEDDTANVSLFITRFKEVVEARLEDSDVGVEELAADMSLSRVQLYRKVKAVTGSSPVELLRTARLNRAYQLLLTTDMSVSEVAYAVGFTAPSYFTKCFKEEYGMVPGDIRK